MSNKTPTPGRPVRRDKLNSLPKQVKDEICRRLHEGDRGVDIIAWLYAQPEVKFAISAQNLSKFKKGPYNRQWKIDHQRGEQRAEQLRAVSRVADRICSEGGGRNINEATASIVSGTLLSLVDALEDFDPTDEESLARAHEFLKMVDRNRARDIAAEKLKIERDRLALEKERAGLNRDRFKLELEKWQKAAAAAVLDKAMSAEVQAILSGDQSQDAKVDLVRQLLFGDYEPYIPEFVNDQ